MQRAAEGMRRPVERVLASIVKGATPSLEKVPAQYRSDLESMETLADGELRKIAESQVSGEHQRKFERLLENSKSGELSEREQQTLTRMRNEADRLTLRKAYAYLLLKYRGHRIPSLSDDR